MSGEHVECPDCDYSTMAHGDDDLECPECGDRLYPADVVEMIREDRDRRHTNLPVSKSAIGSVSAVYEETEELWMLEAEYMGVIDETQVAVGPDGPRIADQDTSELREGLSAIIERSLEERIREHAPGGAYRGP
jgi:hypothetical protein